VGDLDATGDYFICFDTRQGKIVGYKKQNFMKNCQKLILKLQTDSNSSDELGL